MPEPLNGAGLPGERERGTAGDTRGKCGLHLFEMRTAFVLVAPPVLHSRRPRRTGRRRCRARPDELRKQAKRP
jgi:hypothetical protein